MQNSEKVLNPTVVKLGLVSFFSDISSEMLYPITPIFLTTVLGASMTDVGLIEGLASGIASLLQTYVGAWSDKIMRRKPFIILGYVFAALGKPIIGAASSWGVVLFARSLDRTGKGIRTAPRDAMLADAVIPENRGAVFGWHRAMDTSGAALGPLLAILYLQKNGTNLRNAYYWAFIPGMLAVMLVFLLNEKKPAQRSEKKLNYDLGALSNNYKKYLIAWTAFAIANSSDVFMLMKVKQQNIRLTMVILFYCFYNLFYALLSPYFGKLSDHIPRKKVLIFSLFLFIFVYIGFSVATLPWHFWFLFGIYGLHMAASEGVGKAMVVDLVPPHLKATGLGVLGTATGLATIAASTIAGLLWDHWGSNWTFLFGAVGAACAILLLLFVEDKNLVNRS